jgi:cation transport regulator ChaC
VSFRSGAIEMTDPAGPLWYFGYGSNMNRSVFLGRRQMQPIDVRRACLPGYALRFNIPIGPGERGVANVEPLLESQVWGVAYLLTPADFDRLDRTEGVSAGLYQRHPVELMADGDERLQGFTYRSTLITEGRKPSLRYLGLLLEGARQHGLPTDYVTYLERLERAWDERVGPRERDPEP